MQAILYWLLAILLFSAVVLVHELGHFWAARAAGVAVKEFSIGFGPCVFKRKTKKNVQISLRALPFGGYCRFFADDEDGVADHPDAYSKVKVGRRALVAVAGPFANYLIAFVLLFVLFAGVGFLVASPEIGELMPGMPAEAAGFQVGDRIVAVNDIETPDTFAISETIRLSETDVLHFTLERTGERIEVAVTPQFNVEENRAMIGIVYGKEAYRLPIGTSITAAWEQTVYMSGMIIDLLKDLVVKGEGVDELAGPIGTVTIIREETESGGVRSYLQLAAIISVNLGLFNLLPIPGLDGSKLVFLAFEKIRGKRMDPNKEGLVLLIGFGFLAIVMVLALYQDIARLFS